MTAQTTDGLLIGEVVRRTGLSERTLRYYEQLDLLAPARDTAGRRRYGPADLDRLYRVRLLRALGTRVVDLDPDADDLASLAGRHLDDLDARLAGLARQRERVRALEDRLLGGEAPTDQALLDLLEGLTSDEPALTRRITLLVYRDLRAAHDYLVETFALAAGEITEVDGRVVHAEVHAGDGVIWLHPELPHERLSSPATVGASTASLAVQVDDVDAHYAHTAAAGAVIAYPPADQPYGCREYGARDLDGHLWSFQQPLSEEQR